MDSAAPAGPEARAVLVDALGDASHAVRLQAVGSLRAWKDAAPDLRAHLQREGSEETQRAGLEAVGRQGTPEERQPLRAWAAGRSQDLLEEVDKALRDLARRAGLPEPEPVVDRSR